MEKILKTYLNLTDDTAEDIKEIDEQIEMWEKEIEKAKAKRSRLALKDYKKQAEEMFLLFADRYLEKVFKVKHGNSVMSSEVICYVTDLKQTNNNGNVTITLCGNILSKDLKECGFKHYNLWMDGVDYTRVEGTFNSVKLEEIPYQEWEKCVDNYLAFKKDSLMNRDNNFVTLNDDFVL